MKQKISSKIVADKIGIGHPALVRIMCDMVSMGTLSKSVLPSRDGDIRWNAETRLSLGDLVALAVHQRLSREVTDTLVRIFERSSRSKAPLVSTDINHPPLSDVLRDQALTHAIQQLRDGAGDAGQMASDFGIRIIGDDLWIGTSTPYMADAAKKGGLAPGQLSAMLCNIDGAVRHSTKKFGRHGSKVVAVPIDAFISALEDE